MIKQVQLRGISRTPSDRMTSDGGCSESLNIILDNTESAPAPVQRDITDSVFGSDVPCSIFHIHKMTNATWYIGFESGKLYAYRDKEEGEGFYSYGDIAFTGDPQIVSIGNTLIVYATNPYYFLYKDDTYKFLGNSIPSPSIEVVTEPISVSLGGNDYYESADIYGTGIREDFDACAGKIWDAVTIKTGEYRKSGVFFAPFFLRYAVKLYDGSYINQSVPIMVGCGKTVDWLQAWRDDNLTVEGSDVILNYKLTNLFSVKVRMLEEDFSSWSDIISSVDFFVSQPIYTPAFNSNIRGVADADKTTHTQRFIFDGMGSEDRKDTVLNAVLSQSLFYFVRSFSFDSDKDIKELNDGNLTIDNSDDVGGGNLPAHQTLTDSYRDGSQYLPINGLSLYNNRVMMYGAKEILPSGRQFLNGAVFSTGSDVSGKVKLCFKIDSGAEAKYVVSNYADGTQWFKKSFRHSSDSKLWLGMEINEAAGTYEQGDKFYAYAPTSWICFPDSRCTEVKIYVPLDADYTQVYKIAMSPHPNLNCAYAFLGFGISSIGFGESETMYHVVPRNDMILTHPNKLFQSAFENPFSFPASGIITFSDEIVGAATTSVPLSQGQFGQFPLYVFTKGGIQVLSVGDEGDFLANSASPNLSRHIAMENTILSIEQAVIFTTERGVMLLSGDSVQELSSDMNGTPFILYDDTKHVLQSSPWSGLVDAVSQKDTFMAFMREATPAYDANGARLLFFRKDSPYLYVYMLHTQSWHKQSINPVRSMHILNSYPDCLVSVGEQADARIMNFSTYLEDASLLSDTDNPCKGIIITRPLELDAPDLRKSLKCIRVRGKFNRGDVKYMLLGSFDGLHWKRLSSLRGGSYKVFRIVLLCNLTPSERLSWIDVDYDVRFNDKLR